VKKTEILRAVKAFLDPRMGIYRIARRGVMTTTTAKSTHSPAPWHVRRAPKPTDGAYDFAICTEDTQIIAAAFGRSSVSHYHDSEANARLIAAAPELLELLRRIVVRDGLNDNQWFWLHDCKELLARIDGDKP
jgi:hypothetical protein